MEIVNAIIDHADSFRWIFALACFWGFYRWMNTGNGIEWRDFVAAEKENGTHRGDVNRLGQSVGIAVSAFAIVATAPKAHTDFAGFALVLVPVLGFLGGVAAYAAALRAKGAQVQTTTTTEPAPATPAPVKTTTTTIEPAAAPQPAVTPAPENPLTGAIPAAEVQTKAP